MIYSSQLFAQVPNWTVDYSLYEYNMIITGVIHLNDSLIEQEDSLKVAAFIGEQCRGVAYYKTYDFVEGSRINMTLFSNVNNELITLKAYLPKQDTIVDINQTYEFVNLGRQGTLENPVILDVFINYTTVFNKKNVKLEIFPNPTSGYISIRSNNPSNEVALNIYNSIGKKVFADQVDLYLNPTIDISGFASGVYFVNVISNQDNQTKRIIVN